jgi:hypothetical protein
MCDISNSKSARLSFLPDDLNSLPICDRLPFHACLEFLNGEPRIMPLNSQQLVEVANDIHL